MNSSVGLAAPTQPEDSGPTPLAASTEPSNGNPEPVTASEDGNE